MEVIDMNYEKIKEELMKRYLYLYENKELILALCIDRGIEKQKILLKIKEYQNLLKKNLSIKGDEKISELLKKYIDNYISEIDNEKYYLMYDVNDDIVLMFENFLFSDSIMEELDLYKHIEAVKLNKDYLEAFNYSIELLEERRKCNIQLRKLPTFTVWKILSYVRRKNINNKVLLEALDKYYNIDRFMITGDDYVSGYHLLECDYDTFGDNGLNKYPNDIIISDGIIVSSYKNCFEIEDEYFTTLSDNEKLDNSSNNIAKSNFMLLLANMTNLDIENKIIIRNKLKHNSKTLLK